MINTGIQNHPCIIAWSLGNGSGMGGDITAMEERIRRLDQTGPSQTEEFLRTEGKREGRKQQLRQ